MSVSKSPNRMPPGQALAAWLDRYGQDAGITPATLCRMEADLRTFGCSEIDPGEDNLRDLYRVALKNYGLCEKNGQDALH